MPSNHSENDNTQSFVPLVKGTKVGHYTIIEKIGAGGMGEVYLAEDTELNRKVALKFLPAQLSQDEDYRARFKREAQAAAKLNHPNIITIYEVGEYHWRPFIAMEYVRGESLNEMLKELDTSVEKAVKIALEICEGLDKAHREGIIHRDIKPANIVIDAEGMAKILDFGLATIKGTDKITKTGSTMGTMGYMSPEQVRGEEVDHRSDLFSMGVMLYEMITGKSPFKCENQAATLNAILNDSPEPLARYKSEVPEEIQRIVSKLLDKDVELRYQNSADVITDLKRFDIGRHSEITAVQPKDWWNRFVVTGAVAVLLIMATLWLYQEYYTVPSEQSELIRKKLAVLPFENLGSSEDKYFADGITDEITARLAGIRALQVTSRTSAMQYRNSNKSAKIIGEELGVDYLLEGTIRWDKSGDTDIVRIIPQLIRVSDDSHIWASTFERAITKIFAVQAEIAATIADTLGIALLDRERISIETEPTQNLEAYGYYLRGKDFWNESRDAEHALVMFQKAIGLDSDFFQVHRMLAQIYGYQYINNMCDSVECYQLAKNAAENAFRLALGDPEGNLAMGYFHYYCSRDYKKAYDQFTLALKGQPNNGELMEAIGYVLRRWGRWDEALASQFQAFQLDPRNGSAINGLIRTLFYMHRIIEAKQINDDALEWAPTSEQLLVWRIFLTFHTTEDSTVIYNAIDDFENNVGKSSTNFWLETCDIFRRDYKSALNRRREIGGYAMSDSLEYYMGKGDIYSYSGDNEMSLKYYDSAFKIAENRLANKPDNALSHMDMATVYAGLGRNDEAVKEGEAAVEMMPLSKDALNGASFMISLADIYIKTGEHNKAIDLLKRLLEIPSTLQVPILRFHPVYDPLRDNPRFQALLEKYQ